MYGFLISLTRICIGLKFLVLLLMVFVDLIQRDAYRLHCIWLSHFWAAYITRFTLSSHTLIYVGIFAVARIVCNRMLFFKLYLKFCYKILRINNLFYIFISCLVGVILFAIYLRHVLVLCCVKLRADSI